MDAKRKEMERKLSNVLVRLHDRLRKLYGPPGDDWNLEIMMFSGAMVLTALTDRAELSLDEANRIGRALADTLTKRWAQVFKKPLQQTQTLFGDRYAEYERVIARSFSEPALNGLLADALDRHILGRAAGDAERGVHFASICTLSVDMVRPVFGLEARITDEQIDAVMPKEPGTPVLDG